MRIRWHARKKDSDAAFDEIDRLEELGDDRGIRQVERHVAGLEKIIEDSGPASAELERSRIAGLESELSQLRIYRFEDPARAFQHDRLESLLGRLNELDGAALRDPNLGS